MLCDVYIDSPPMMVSFQEFSPSVNLVLCSYDCDEPGSGRVHAGSECVHVVREVSGLGFHTEFPSHHTSMLLAQLGKLHNAIWRFKLMHQYSQKEENKRGEEKMAGREVQMNHYFSLRSV